MGYEKFQIESLENEKKERMMGFYVNAASSRLSYLFISSLLSPFSSVPEGPHYSTVLESNRYC